MGAVILWGWDETNKVFRKVLVDLDGKLIIDPEVTAALEADVGDASGSTLGSLYGILGNPAESFLTMLNDIQDAIAALPTAKSFETVRVAQTISPLTAYYPPDNHMLTGIIVNYEGIKIQAKDYGGAWRVWTPYATWAADVLYTPNIACDGTNVRVYNGAGSTLNFTLYLMRQA